MFTKYMHLERFGNVGVEGIEQGICYVFPKLDGTNAQLWWEGDDRNGKVMAGSRNRVLSLENDNAGFYNWAVNQMNLWIMLKANPDLTLYGEWLVPHSLKTYRDDAWNKFYCFDIYDRKKKIYLSYERCEEIWKEHKIDYLPPLGIAKNGTYEIFQNYLEKNVFLIQEGQGYGEGIVIKNYDWTNKFGDVVWAKLITNQFKEVHHREMGAPIIGGNSVEEDIVDKYVNQHLVDKVVAKLEVEHGGWNSKLIPQLLGVVYYDLITEEMWEILKEFNKPKIDFGFLNRLTISKIKELRKDIF